MDNADKLKVIENWNLNPNANLDQPIGDIKLRPRQYRGLERLEINTLGEWLLWNQKGGLATNGRPEGFSQKSIANFTVDVLKKLR